MFIERLKVLLKSFCLPFELRLQVEFSNVQLIEKINFT